VDGFMSTSPRDHLPELTALLDERIAVLDGAMGTMIQRHKLSETDFRGERFKNHFKDLQGNNDLLCITRPDVIRGIHEQYFEAGSNIVETNTFNATVINQSEYGLENIAYDINVAAAKVACEARDIWRNRDPKRPRFVAGSIGPMAKSLSFSPKVDDASFRTVTFDQVKDAYKEQVRGLLDGGVDILLPETAFDTLNMKAAIVAIDEVFREGGRIVPVMLSMTVVDKSGRNLSGQLVDAWYTSIEHAHPLSVGINCSLGGNDIRPYVEELAGLAPELVSC
jgi:5-methyltetrahydrofolate--homocysteine methyltransferase